MTLPTDVIDCGKDTKGRTVHMSERMCVAWTVTVDKFKKEFPGKELFIVQGAWRSLDPEGGAPGSKHFHDFSGALDIRTFNLTRDEQDGLIRIARSIGWAAWLRDEEHVPGHFVNDAHAHLALLGEPLKVGGKQNVFDGLFTQMERYHDGGEGSDGLAAGTRPFPGKDYHPRPDPIPVFDLDEAENDMQLTDTLRLTKETADALGEGAKEGDEITVGGLLQKMARHAALAVKLTDKVPLTEETAAALGRGLQEGSTITVGGLLQKMARHAALADDSDGSPG
jgi:hypothetical protein